LLIESVKLVLAVVDVSGSIWNMLVSAGVASLALTLAFVGIAACVAAGFDL
jgi:small-conductance mechanosensitive channel